MTPIIKLVAVTIAGLILASLVAVVVLISAGRAHAGMTSSPNTFAVSYVERGGHHGHGKH